MSSKQQNIQIPCVPNMYPEYVEYNARRPDAVYEQLTLLTQSAAGVAFLLQLALLGD